MGLPFFGGKEKDTNQFYFGLSVSLTELVGSLYLVSPEGIEIEMQRHHALTSGWDHIIEDTDDLLAQMEEEKRLHIREVIFIVFSSLIDPQKQEIKKIYLDGMKRIAKELELKPLGYIECQDALFAHVQQKDQALMHALFAEVDGQTISATLYKGERIVYRGQTMHTGELAHDMEQLFLQIHKDMMLPSRIILYHTGVDIHQELMHIHTYHWQSDLFIQSPRLELIPERVLSQSIASLFHQQMKEQEHGNSNAAVMQEALPSDKPTHKTPEHKEQADSVASVDGFVVGKDIVAETQKRKISFPHFSLKRLVSMPSMIVGLLRGNQGSKASKKSAFLIPVLGILLISASIFILAYAFHSATVRIYVPFQQVTKQITIPPGSTDVTIQSATASAQLSDTIATTGTRDVGDKAKGQVSLYNRDFSDKTIAAGTPLSTASGVTFTTDQSATIPKATEGTDFSTQPGKTTVNVTASTIGSDSNIAKDTRMSIGTFDENTIFGVNDAAFSGGTKKTIRIVAAKDLENLKTVMTTKAKQQKFADPTQTLSSDARIISNLSEVGLQNITYSQSIGDEAAQVTMKADAIQTAYWYADSQMRSVAQAAISSDVPSGYILPPDKISYTITKAVQSKDGFALDVDISGHAVKNINVADIRNKLPGMSQNAVESMLRTQYAAEGVEIAITSPLFIFDHRLPFFKSHITVTTQSL